ncbi:MAG TPA: response regulator [Caldilineae bacterium]|nr:response regulator [Caldilineae bacterium]
MSPRILVIDDDDDTHLFVKLTLQPHGHQIIDAYTVAQGLKAARREKPDLIVLEPAIEDGAGFDLCRRLHLLPGGRTRPILILSRLRRREDIVRGLEHGASAYLTKPADTTELIFRVRSLLRYEQVPHPVVILVIGAKAGVGATTIAVNVGVALAHRWREDVILIDAEIPGGDPAIHLGLQPEHTLADLISYGDEIEIEMIERVFCKHESGLQLISAPAEGFDRPSDPEFLTPILSAMAERQSYVIIDAPETPGDQVRSLVQQAEHVLIVVTPELTALRRAEVLLESVASERPGGYMDVGREYRLIVNQADRRGGLTVEDFPSELKSYAMVQLPYDPRRVLSSINAGVPLVLRSPRSRLARGIVQLAQSLRRGDQQEPAGQRPWAFIQSVLHQLGVSPFRMK